MPRREHPRMRIWIPALLAGALALSAAARAERLPIRVYTANDGLAGDEINTILQDSRGFLWIGTDTGLSHFDGSRFVSYAPLQGLPSPHVTALLETPDGGLLVGTTGGLARLDLKPASAGRLFKPAPDSPARSPERISALLADGRSVWLAGTRTGGGLFHFSPAGDRPGLEEVKGASGASLAGITALAPDGVGGLWVGGPARLLPRLAGGRWSAPPALPPARISALLLDGQHRLWIATADALWVLEPGKTEAVRRLDARSGFAGVRRPGAMLQTRDGRLWLATDAGLGVLDGQGLRTYTRRNGLPADELVALAEDRDGNLWVGTRSHGLMRLARDGFLTYAAAGETEGPEVGEIFEDSRSNLYVWG